MDRVLAIIDAYVGQVADRTGRDAILAVASDHGMTTNDRHWKPNVVLAQAGLLALDGAGGVDLARTKAIYFPGNSGYVLINRQGRPGGIVAPAEEEDVRHRVAAALRGATDPATGRSLGVTVTDVRVPAPGLGGPHAGDLFVEVAAPGIAISSRLTGEGIEARRAEGTHFQDPASRRLLGSFLIAGPGVAAGADLGIIQQVDIAPTLAALLGMDPPAHAVGTALAAALARQP
jgi:predicted AlkP superfamily phosphohydrolase/phosphomutase